MTRKLTLRIQNPCSQSWDTMKPEADGKFFARCEKKVVDLSHLSETELVLLLGRAEGRLCVRAKTSQLKEYALPSQAMVTPGFRLFYAGLLSLLLLLAPKQASSAPWKEPVPVEMVRHHDKMDTTSGAKESQVITVEGMVASLEDNSPLPGVNIFLEGSKISTVTDKDGRYKLSFPRQKRMFLVAQFIGFVSVEVDLLTRAGEHMQLDMGMVADTMMLGEVVMPGGFFGRLWWRIKGIF